jgi:hypothetical protein
VFTKIGLELIAILRPLFSQTCILAELFFDFLGSIVSCLLVFSDLLFDVVDHLANFFI